MKTLALVALVTGIFGPLLPPLLQAALVGTIVGLTAAPFLPGAAGVASDVRGGGHRGRHS